MPGPNSAPNGDRRIVRGDLNEQFVIQKRTDEDGNEYSIQIPRREYLAARGKLITGKTAHKSR